MNCKERFLSALKCEQPDRVPVCELTIDEPILRSLAKILIPNWKAIFDIETSDIVFSGLQEGSQPLELYCRIVEKLDLDATSYGFSLGLEQISKSKGKDKYGRVYYLSPHGEPVPTEPLIKDFSDLEDFEMISKLEEEDFFAQKEIEKEFGNSKAHLMLLNDPFKISWSLRGGMENLLMDFIRSPELVNRLVDIATEFLLGVIDLSVDIGVDIYVMDGDYADERNLIFSRDHYFKYFKSPHKKIVDYIHNRGAKIVKHSDGNVWPLLDDFLKAGFDGINPIQPQCMDIRKVKDYLAGEMAIIGNIDCRNLLVTGSEDEVKSEVKDTIQKVGPGGGYIISSSNSIHPGCKPENYIAMVEAAHEYGAYPLSTT